MVTLQLQGVGAHYGSRTVLANVNTPVFHAGQVVAVIGPLTSVIRPTPTGDRPLAQPLSKVASAAAVTIFFNML